MNYLISSYSVNPYHGSEDGVGWNWVLQYEKHWKPGDRIILLTKQYNEEATKRGFKEFGIQHIELVIVDVPLWLNWFREKYSMFHHMYYILWQNWAWMWVKHSGIKFDEIHHVTMGDYRIPGKMYKAGAARTIFGPVGGAQTTPKSLKCYEKSQLTADFRTAVNRMCDYNPFYKKAIRGFTEVYASNLETYNQVSRLRNGMTTGRIVELGITEEMRNISINRNIESKQGKGLNILFVGRLIEKKGVIFLMEVAKKLKDKTEFNLDIIGGGYLEDTLRKYVSDNDLGNSVRFLGEIDHQNIIDKYKNADVFVLPSLRETGGTVLIEAMACGLPIVAFDTSFCSELRENECGLFIDVDQSLENIQEDYCSALVRLADDPALRATLGANGHRFVNENLCWDRKYQAIVEHG